MVRDLPIKLLINEEISWSSMGEHGKGVPGICAVFGTLYPVIRRQSAVRSDESLKPR